MDKQTTQRSKRRRSNKGLIVVLVIVILALLGLIACLLFGRLSDGKEANTPPTVTATPTATAQLAIDPNAGALITPPLRQWNPAWPSPAEAA